MQLKSHRSFFVFGLAVCVSPSGCSRQIYLAARRAVNPAEPTASLQRSVSGHLGFYWLILKSAAEEEKVAVGGCSSASRLGRLQD